MSDVTEEVKIDKWNYIIFWIWTLAMLVTGIVIGILLNGIR